VPTLLELLGAPVPSDLHGRSVAPQLQSDESTVTLQDDVFFMWNPRPGQTDRAAEDIPPEELAVAGSAQRWNQALNDVTRTIVTPDGIRYTHSLVLGEHELFDLRQDPTESTNLAAVDPPRDVIGGLRQRLAAWQDKIEDPAERVSAETHQP